MSGPRGLAWVLLGVWSVWLLALQGLLASGGALGGWTPDLGLVLLLGLGSGLRGRQILPAVLLVSAARIAFTSDPPLAVLVGYWGVLGAAGWLRETLDIDQAIPRAFFAAFFVLVLSVYWSLSARALLGADVPGLPPIELAWACAAGTGIATLFAPLLGRLPGLSPLQRPRR